MSVRLFDIPHRKNSTVSSQNSSFCPAGNTDRFLPPCDLAPLTTDVETCMYRPLERNLRPQSNLTANCTHKNVRPSLSQPPQLSRTGNNHRHLVPLSSALAYYGLS